MCRRCELDYATCVGMVNMEIIVQNKRASGPTPASAGVLSCAGVPLCTTEKSDHTTKPVVHFGDAPPMQIFSAVDIPTGTSSFSISWSRSELLRIGWF